MDFSTSLHYPLTSDRAKPKCLFIGPHSEGNSPARQRSKVIYEQIVEPAAEAFGLQAEDALCDGPRVISPGMFDKIRGARVIVADLSGADACVTYALAFAHSLARCTVFVIQELGSLPFDLEGMHHIRFDHEDPESIRRAKDKFSVQLTEFADLGWISVTNPFFHVAFVKPQAGRVPSID